MNRPDPIPHEELKAGDIVYVVATDIWELAHASELTTDAIVVSHGRSLRFAYIHDRCYVDDGRVLLASYPVLDVVFFRSRRDAALDAYYQKLILLQKDTEVLRSYSKSLEQ